MADVVGRIGSAVEITETDEFDSPTRTVNLRDASGRLHGRLQWVTDEVDEGFQRAVLEFCIETMRTHPTSRRRSPSAAS